LLPAGGLLNLPNFGLFHLRARAAALSMVHRSSARPWSSFEVTQARAETRFRRIGYNLGAPGDRYDDNGTLWVRAVHGGRDIRVETEPKELDWFVLGATNDWIGQSGVQGAARLWLPTALKQSKSSQTRSNYRVRLFFAEPAAARIGERVFDVLLEGQPMLTDLDIAAAGDSLVIREFENVPVVGMLDIELKAKTGQPILCGVELVAAVDAEAGN
jgi:hypothetical protein